LCQAKSQGEKNREGGFFVHLKTRAQEKNPLRRKKKDCRGGGAAERSSGTPAKHGGVRYREGGNKKNWARETARAEDLQPCSGEFGVWGRVPFLGEGGKMGEKLIGTTRKPERSR